MNIIDRFLVFFDPAYEAERTLRRQVKRLRVSERVRIVEDDGDEIRGTVKRVDPTGETFDVLWDDGDRNTLWCSDIDIIERIDRSLP